jgi:hypothetical protein
MEVLVATMLTTLFELECKEFEKKFPKENVREQLEYGNRFLSAGALEMEVTDTLTVGNVPYSMSKDQLSAEFSKRGIEVADMDIRDRYAKRKKGGKRLLNRETFVKLMCVTAVEKAVEVTNGIYVRGSQGEARQITVAASDVQLNAAKHSPKKLSRERKGKSRRARASGGAGGDASGSTVSSKATSGATAATSPRTSNPNPRTASSPRKKASSPRPKAGSND